MKHGGTEYTETHGGVRRGSNAIASQHQLQLLTYLRLSGRWLGLLIKLQR